MNISRPFYLKSLIALLLATSPTLISCSGSKTTTVSTTEVHRADHNQLSNSDDGSRVEVTRKEEVTKDDEHHGIFSILADIIALPFRALAAIF